MCVKKRVLITTSRWEIPETLAEFIKFFQEKLRELPEECRATAVIDLDVSQDFNSTEVTYEIEYYRSETEEEEFERQVKEATSTTKARATKLAQYKKLQKELGLGE